MPTEPNRNATTTAPAAIENEIPAYRAISPSAVVALVLGVFSFLSFVSWYFLVLPVAAILVGIRADRKIRRFPDMLTGRGLAQAGFGLGLIFGLTSVAVATVQGLVRVRQATAFAHAYEKVLTKQSFADALWHGQNADSRASFTPDALYAEMNKPGPSQVMFEEQYKALRELKKAVAESKGDIHFVRIESHGEQDLTQFAGVVYAIHSDSAREPAQRERHALAVFKWGGSTKRPPIWWVSDVIFPYKDKSFVAPAPEKKAGDDGHGHSH